MTVALAGTGGDEVFGGYPSFVEIPRVLRAGAWLPAAADRRRRPARCRGHGHAGRAPGQRGLLGRAAWWRRRRRAGARSPTWRAPAHDALGALPGLLRPVHARDPGRPGRRAPCGTRSARQRHGLPAEVAAAWRAAHRGQRAAARGLGAGAVELHRRAPAARHRRGQHGRRASRCACRCSTTSWPRRWPASTRRAASRRPGKKQLLRDVALARLDPAIFDRPKSRLRAAHRHLGAPAPAAARCRRSSPTPRWPRRVGLRGEAVRTLWRSFCDGPAGPLLVARLGALRAPVVVPGPTTCRWRHDAAGPHPSVLFLSGLQIHPPLSGGNLRSFALASALARHGLDVLRVLPGRPQAGLPGPPSVAACSAGPTASRSTSIAGRSRLPGPVRQLRARAAAPVAHRLPAGGRRVARARSCCPPLLREKLSWCDVVVADFPFVHPIFRRRPRGAGCAC